MQRFASAAIWKRNWTPSLPLGSKGVELFENDLLSFNGTPTDIRGMIDGLGLKLITFQPCRDFEGMPGQRRDRVFQRAERKFDVMGSSAAICS